MVLLADAQVLSVSSLRYTSLWWVANNRKISRRMIWPGNLVSVTLRTQCTKIVQKGSDGIRGAFARYRGLDMSVLELSCITLSLDFSLSSERLCFRYLDRTYNPVVNQMFGGTTGLSLSQVTSTGLRFPDSLAALDPHGLPSGTPLIGVVSSTSLCLSVHYTGTWSAQFLP